MDKKVSVRIVRSDNKEFNIDGTDWKIPSSGGLDGFGLFENEIKTIGNASGDGSYVASVRVSEKERTIIAKSVNPLLNDVLRREATSFFNGRFGYKVYVTYMGLTRWCDCKLYKFSCPMGNVNRLMNLTLVFLSPNPYLKSVDEFGKNIAEVTGMAAFPFLCRKNYGVTAGRYNFAKMVVLENDGDVETYCKAVFRAHGTVKNPKLIIRGKYVRILDTMIKGDVIIIDFAANPPTVDKNGVNFIGNTDRTSSYEGMELVVGDTEVQFDADDGTNLLDVSIYYNKLYGAM